MQRRRELLENITPARSYTSEEVDALAKNIDKHGLREPILVNGVSSMIIDGSKRYAALMSLGHDSADIRVSDDILEVTELIHEQSMKQKPSVSRIVDYLNSLHDLIGRTKNRLTINPRWRANHPEMPVVRQPSRQMLTYMINDAMSSAMCLRLVYMTRLARGGDELAIELMKAIESEELTPHQAFLRHNKSMPGFTGAVIKPSEQNEFLKNASLNLAGAVAAFRTLRSPVQAEDLRKHLASLRRSRTELYALIRALEKEGK